MNSIFDQVVDRHNTGCWKIDRSMEFFGREDVIPLSVADMDFQAAPAIRQAFQERLDHGIFGYGNITVEYLNSIREWLKRKHSWSVLNKEIIYSGGVISSINVLVNLLTKENDSIIIQPPIYPPFRHLIKANDRRILNNQLILKEGHYCIDFDDFENKCQQGARVFILCNPHNPTGRVFTKEELTQLVGICKHYEVLIFSDEIHCDLAYDGFTHIPIGSINDSAKEITITFMSPSKTFNIAGIPSSYLIVQNELLRVKIEKYLTHSDMFIVNVFALLATIAAYQKSENWLQELLKYLSETRDYILSRIKKDLPHVEMIFPEATYLAWLNFNNFSQSEDELSNILVHKAGLALNRGSTYGPGGNKYFRLNFACPRVIVKQALDQLIANFTG
jgi:cysteine-S-conjugate beta-lyase